VVPAQDNGVPTQRIVTRNEDVLDPEDVIAGCLALLIRLVERVLQVIALPGELAFVVREQPAQDRR
jgi:hypothetical protein